MVEKTSNQGERSVGPLLKQLIDKVGYQKCWDEVQKNSGIKLEEQLERYPEFGQRPSVDLIVYPNPEERHQIRLEVLDREAKALSATTTLNGIQQELIIRNANEFRLRDNPSLTDIEAIIKDFKTWGLNGITSEQIIKRTDEVANLARQRFTELKP